MNPFIPQAKHSRLVLVPFAELGLKTTLDVLNKVHNCDFLRAKGYAPLENEDREEATRTVATSGEDWLYTLIWSMSGEEPRYLLRKWMPVESYSPTVERDDEIDASQDILLVKL